MTNSPGGQAESALKETPDQQDWRWQALQARTKDYDGRLFYGVKTTGIYCRPSCAARLAKPKNIEFYASGAEAETAGYRPCKRCKPEQVSLSEQQSMMIASLCRILENSDQPPSLNELARLAGLSAYHLHRLFKASTGVTPKGYAKAHRMKRLHKNLKQTPTVTEAIFASGYGSTSRFYENTADLLGMTATKYRRGGHAITIEFTVSKCSLGQVLVAKSDVGICAIFLGDQKTTLVNDLHKRFPQAELKAADNQLQQEVAAVINMIETATQNLSLPLDIRGTAFQQRVWQELRKIPVGKTATYTQVAERIGKPKSARAVALACAANSLAVAIPCHRVIRQDGQLSGYRWGIERKRNLLDKESI